MSKIRAFIDLGTNTFHLLIAEIKGNESKILYRTREIVGLGAGGINKGIILPDAIDRGIACLLDFKEKCQEYHVEKINAFGTSALRNAGNRAEFLDKVREQTDIVIDVIDGDKEAELIQLGISSSLLSINEPYLIMDIGGGSTEFILVDKDKIVKKRSFEVGVQRLLSAYFTSDPIPADSYQDLRSYLNKFLEELSTFKQYDPSILVGASGTFTTLLRMFTEENNVPITASTTVPTTYFNNLFTKLIELPRKERLALPGMSAPRVDLIVVGSCLVEHVLHEFGFNGFLVSGNGLKEGAMHLATEGKL